ncbi:MAG: glycosyltransferase family 4 protein [Chloroflexi bacterium]|nr:glycosyltransferase family 4 protein [Chloroflexota bacterium]
MRSSRVQIHRNTKEIEVIAPNLNRRLSGVTATIARLVPLQAKIMGVVATGPGLPASVPHISLPQTLFLPRRRSPYSPWRVWHARRNVEMLLGLALRYLLGKRLRLLFTSASQRHHTRYTRWLISRMDSLISTSHKTASYLDRSSTVVHHGIDTELFFPVANKADSRRALGLPEHGILVGCYGRIRHQKGTDVFVDSLFKLLADFPEMIGVVLGRATESHLDFERSLREQVARRGWSDRILFPGEAQVNEMPTWYQALDIFVAPQRWEGFGLTPLEAMACGVPVVATKVGAFDELIRPAKTGYLIPPGEIDALVDSLRGLLADPVLRQGMGEAARDHVLANFRIENEVEALNAIYRQLLS